MTKLAKAYCNICKKITTHSTWPTLIEDMPNSEYMSCGKCKALRMDPQSEITYNGAAVILPHSCSHNNNKICEHCNKMIGMAEQEDSLTTRTLSHSALYLSVCLYPLTLTLYLGDFA